MLVAAWRIATRVRNAVMLVTGRPSDMVPTDARDLAAWPRCSATPGRERHVLDDYRRITRRARGVVERVFYA